MDNIVEDGNCQDESFIVVHDTTFVDEKLECSYKKLLEDYEKLEKRHGELLKLMNELLKIKSTNLVDGLENLDEIRQKITQILYNEMRRHTIFSFSSILNSYSTYQPIKSKKDTDNLNVD